MPIGSGNFISLALGSHNQVTGDGHFNLESTITHTSTSQTIDTFTLSDTQDTLHIQGTLDGKDAYTMEMQVKKDGSVFFSVSIEGEETMDDRILLKFDTFKEERTYGLV